MGFGIATTAIIPLREEPRHQSEMISQVLFGETMKVVDLQDEWTKVKLDYDGSEGWIDNGMYHNLNANDYTVLKEANTLVLDTMSDIIIGNNVQPMRVMPGSEIHCNGQQSNKMVVGNEIYSLKHRTSIPMRGNIRHSVMTKALEYLNAPYLWGGRSLFGIDCSAFTQIVFKLHGILLPREVEDQFSVGRLVKEMHEAMFGDLAFMANEQGQICHVGIIIEPNKIIHADSFVRFAYINEKQVFNVDSKTSKFKIAYIKNVID
jgi:cell wall-associated NlpC family hydrolase